VFRTKNARRAPFYIISAGNAVLMTVVIILHDICDNSPTCVRSFAKVEYHGHAFIVRKRTQGVPKSVLWIRIRSDRKLLAGS
jgi:hypothetical protein